MDTQRATRDHHDGHTATAVAGAGAPPTLQPEGSGTVARPVRDIAHDDLERILGAMVHEISNSLNSIMSGAQLANLLMERGRLGDARTALDRAEQDCLRAARQLREGRSLALLQVPEAHGGVDLDMLLTECGDACADLGEVRIGCDPELPPVHGNAVALKRLFVEIMDNAFQFGAHNLQVTATIAIGGNVLIEFRDDGPGVSIAAATVCNPFTTSEPREHDGLGLAYAARIAAACGGSIGVGEVARGALFRVTLPLEGALGGCAE